MAPAPTAPPAFQTASFLYLEPDPKYVHEKPYKLRYDPGDGVPRTNVTNEKRNGVLIEDVRGQAEQPFEEKGFTWKTVKSALSPEDFYNEQKVQNVYYPELRKLLQKLLKPSRIEFIEHRVRLAEGIADNANSDGHRPGSDTRSSQ